MIERVSHFSLSETHQKNPKKKKILPAFQNSHLIIHWLFRHLVVHLAAGSPIRRPIQRRLCLRANMQTRPLRRNGQLCRRGHKLCSLRHRPKLHRLPPTIPRPSHQPHRTHHPIWLRPFLDQRPQGSHYPDSHPNGHFCRRRYYIIGVVVYFQI